MTKEQIIQQHSELCIKEIQLFEQLEQVRKSRRELVNLLSGMQLAEQASLVTKEP